MIGYDDLLSSDDESDKESNLFVKHLRFFFPSLAYEIFEIMNFFFIKLENVLLPLMITAIVSRHCYPI